ncbi:MAG: F0F1 ATP synthase subunit B, partial [Chloroflexi bacterium]|nr:F0F1 ATP synthase subunit B [Chloroflexota bacterium]
LLVQIFDFLIILVVLRVWVYKPILNMLDQRKQRIAQGLEDARVAAEARANAEADAQKIIAAAQQQANARVGEATQRAEKATIDVRVAADKEAARIIAKAREEAELERNRVLGDLRGQVAGLAIAAAQKLIGEALDEQRQRSLIDQFFSGVKSGKVQILEGEQVSGAAAEVTSALPLTATEQSAVRTDIAGRLGGGGAVAFRVDPAIMGGLIVRVGDKVLDGSVSGKLESLREAMH